MIKFLFLGDITGRPAHQKVIEQVPLLKDEYNLDFVVANCENAADGLGMEPEQCEQLFECGVDVLTSGNHAFHIPEINEYFKNEPRLIRPENMDSSLPGKGHVIVTNKKGKRLGVMNIMGNMMMDDSVDGHSFDTADKLLNDMQLGRDVDALMIDFHATSTWETGAMGFFVDGRASLLVGTHTHIPTHDARILPDGTAFQTDAGMCGDYNTVIGMDSKFAISKFTDKDSKASPPKSSEPTLCGNIVWVCEDTGLATNVEIFLIGPLEKYLVVNK